VNSANKGYSEKYSSRNGRTSPPALGGLAWLAFCVVFCGVPGLTRAQAEQPEGASNSVASEPSPQPSQQAGQQSDQHISGSISGTVLDQSGAPVGGAQVMLIRENQAPNQQIAGDDGQFSFPDVAPGAFQLIFSQRGWLSKQYPASCSQVRITLPRKSRCM